MNLPSLSVLIALPALAGAGHFGQDTTITSLVSNASTSWSVDGTKMTLFDPESLCLCEEGGFEFRFRSQNAFVTLAPKSVDTTNLVWGYWHDLMNRRFATEVHYNDSAWWRVHGRTADWALEIDRLDFGTSFPNGHRHDSSAVRPHWAKFDATRTWVQWIDSIGHPGGEGRDSISSQSTHLLRCLADTGCTVDSLVVRISRGGNLPSNYTIGMAMFHGDASDTLWLQQETFGGTIPSGALHKFRISNRSSLIVSTFLSWTGYSITTQFPKMIPPNGFVPGWVHVNAVWKFRVSGISDSIVQSAWVPQYYEGVRSRSPGIQGQNLSMHATDLQGRPVFLGTPQAVGSHFLPVQGKLQPVVVGP